MSAGGGNCLLLCQRGKLQIDGVDAHEHLAAFDRLTGVHEPLEHLAGDAKAQVALNSGRHGSAKRTRRRQRIPDHGDTHQRCLRARIGRCLSDARGERKRQRTNHCGSGQTMPEHKYSNRWLR